MSDLDATFAALSGILRRHTAGMSLKTDVPGHLYVELPAATAKARPAFFGAAQTKKAYVSYHLMPVYEHPRLLADTSQALRSRMQGKSCFNFAAVDRALFEELDRLTGRCAMAVRQPGFVPSVATDFPARAGGQHAET